ncbi:NAD(P)H-dependent oxidoreductase [Brevibacillus fluminis]|uniref:NAD(P)H-dependent oxidoreductase n=1 Tax=Brevibacillus fluminis TaxID=511487 RepID=UPI003F89A3C3
MKAYIVFAHPGESSFNHSILQKVTSYMDKEGIDYRVNDLYKTNFQPVFSESDMHNIAEGRVSGDIEEEQQQVTDADLLVMIYPVYWWSQPAILKGWIDRVFTHKFAFRYEADGPVGLLTGKRAIVITTTRESEEEMQRSGMDEVLEKQIADGVLSFVGCKPVAYRNFSAVSHVDDSDRAEMERGVEQLFESVLKPVLL